MKWCAIKSSLLSGSAWNRWDADFWLDEALMKGIHTLTPEQVETRVLTRIYLYKKKGLGELIERARGWAE